MSFSTVTGLWYFDQAMIFNKIINSYWSQWWDNQYSLSSGSYVYSKSNFLVSDYKGDWLILQMPAKIVLGRIRVYAWTALDYRIYGRNSDNLAAGWTMLLDMKNVVYNGLEHYSPALTSTTAYNTFGITVSRSSGPTLGMQELWFQEAYFSPFCNPGTFDFNTSHCIHCQPGWASPVSGATNVSVCQMCQPGTFATSGSSTCASCPPGSYSTAALSSTCTHCLAGKFSTTMFATDASVCTNCPRGTYTQVSGSTLCTNCTLGTYSDLLGSVSNATCVLCPPGE